MKKIQHQDRPTGVGRRQPGTASETKSLFARPVLAALVVASVGAGAYVGAAPMAASAAETHTNCATFDNNGNLISVVPNCTETISQQGGQPQSMPGVDPCTGDTGTLTMNFTHQVFHLTVNGASDVWNTGTQNGTVTFTPDNSSAPSGSGSWEAWFGASLNKQNAVLHDTLNTVIHLTTGQTATFHMIDHMNFAGTGTIVTQFTKGGTPTCH